MIVRLRLTQVHVSRTRPRQGCCREGSRCQVHGHLMSTCLLEHLGYTTRWAICPRNTFKQFIDIRTLQQLLDILTGFKILAQVYLLCDLLRIELCSSEHPLQHFVRLCKQYSIVTTQQIEENNVIKQHYVSNEELDSSDEVF